MDKISLAKNGEDKATSFLRANGYRILERNYRSKFGEIDIIAKDKDCICFIEVKTRSSSNFGLPQDSVIKRKIRHISRAALDYLKRNNLLDLPARFDVVSILDNQADKDNIGIIKDAFCLDNKYIY